jgi:hypothetical protein
MFWQMNKAFIIGVLCLTAIASAQAVSWAVIVAGSNGYGNNKRTPIFGCMHTN